MVDFSFSRVKDLRSIVRAEYVRQAKAAMATRFSRLILTPEQMLAWDIGFSWIHSLFEEFEGPSTEWLVLPEFSPPLVSGRPDLVVVTPKSLVVIEMKTGSSGASVAAKKQVLGYAEDIWGKLRIARERSVYAVVLSNSGQSATKRSEFPTESSPKEAFNLDVAGLRHLLEIIKVKEEDYPFDAEDVLEQLRFSPRPSVIEAATALVAASEDEKVVTGLSTEDEIERVTQIIRELARRAKASRSHEVVVVSGPPGAGKTLVGLRIAHDESIQKLLPGDTGTPLYLTGNGPLVDVLVESLARDEARRIGSTLASARNSAGSKVRLIHGVTQGNLRIETNLIVFDEGQRVWTAERMSRGKSSKEQPSEAEAVLRYLEHHEWALLLVLLGEGQEINKGEAGIVTWLDAVSSRRAAGEEWGLTLPETAADSKELRQKVLPGLSLKVMRRTDNAADMAGWVTNLLDGEFDSAANLRQQFLGFPLVVSRTLDGAKEWLRGQVSIKPGTSGLLASSKSKRLGLYGLDVVAEANRDFPTKNWYLNRLPDLSSSEAFEQAATEFKCQGLELDWVGVCWSWDLVLDGGKWQARTLNSKTSKWNPTNPKFAIYQINAYRVLLTRARRGMVIWVPEGDPHDSSRHPQDMDSIAATLVSAGAVAI